MKKYIFLVLAQLLFNPMSFGAESPDAISYLETLPREIQKEVLAKITSPKVIQKIALSNKQLGLLIQDMKDNREFTPEVLWGFKDVIRSRELSGHTGGVLSIALSNDKQLVLTGSWDGIKLWNTATGEVIKTLLNNGVTAPSVAFSPDKQIAIAALGDGSTRIWDVQTGQIIKILPFDRPALSVALSDDKQIAITGFVDGRARVWDIATGKLIQTLYGHSFFVRGLALSHDKQIAITGSNDRTAKVWSILTEKPLQTLVNDDVVKTVALSADGKIALIGPGNIVKIWDLSTNKVIRTLDGHHDLIDSIALSPDKKLAVTGSCDKTAKIWNIETGELIQTLIGHKDGIFSVALSPDKKMILTGCKDGSAKIWSIERDNQ